MFCTETKTILVKKTHKIGIIKSAEDNTVFATQLFPRMELKLFVEDFVEFTPEMYADWRKDEKNFESILQLILLLNELKEDETQLRHFLNTENFLVDHSLKKEVESIFRQKETSQSSSVDFVNNLNQMESLKSEIDRVLLYKKEVSLLRQKLNGVLSQAMKKVLALKYPQLRKILSTGSIETSADSCAEKLNTFELPEIVSVGAKHQKTSNLKYSLVTKTLLKLKKERKCLLINATETDKNAKYQFLRFQRSKTVQKMPTKHGMTLESFCNNYETMKRDPSEYYNEFGYGRDYVPSENQELQLLKDCNDSFDTDSIYSLSEEFLMEKSASKYSNCESSIMEELKKEMKMDAYMEMVSLNRSVLF